MIDAVPHLASNSQSADAPRLAELQRATVNGMLPDFRFVLGGVLAITLLAVAGLGLVTSARLVREAHMGPLEDPRRLAFAGHSEWNQFYDPDGARRFEGLAGRGETPPRLETPAEIAPVTPRVAAAERTASIRADRIDPDIAFDKTTPTDPPSRAETPAAVTIAAPTGEAVRGPAPDAPGPTESDPPPGERVASAPTTSPEADRLPEPEAPPPMPAEALAPSQPQAADAPQQQAAPPAQPARPKAPFRKRIARAHLHRRVNVAIQPTVPNAGFPGANTPWPGYDSPITGATTTTTKKSPAKLTGTIANRPQ
jgi:hypothetical protein